MIIDFDSIKEEKYPQFKGGDKELMAKMYFDGQTRVMKGRLIPGASIGLHTHSDNCEVLFLTKGNAHVLYDGQTIELHEGQCHYCPSGHSHSLINNSDSAIEFTAVVK